jgi:hypothetical protein
MLVTFQSSATPDVMMLGELAQYLLGIAGKRLEHPGILQHDELPHAIRRIERAITEEEKAEMVEDALNCAAPSSLRERERGVGVGVGFGQRVLPLLDMMRRASRQHADVVWGTNTA